MGSLASALSDAAAMKPRTKCSVGALLAELDDIDRKALLNALASAMGGEAIAAAVRSEGRQMLGATIQRHRKGRCSCEPSEAA